jgi:hypothetical protein
VAAGEVTGLDAQAVASLTRDGLVEVDDGVAQLAGAGAGRSSK